MTNRGIIYNEIISANAINVQPSFSFCFTSETTRFSHFGTKTVDGASWKRINVSLVEITTSTYSSLNLCLVINVAAIAISFQLLGIICNTVDLRTQKNKYPSVLDMKLDNLSVHLKLSKNFSCDLPSTNIDFNNWYIKTINRNTAFPSFFHFLLNLFP